MPNRTHTGRLRARPGPPAGAPPERGAHPLLDAGRRRGLLVVPSLRAGARPGLAVLLHGAGGSAATISELFAPLVRALPGTIWMFPESEGETWDVVAGELGPDVARLDAALAAVFDRCPVHPERIAVGGFSDGASYALTLGLANGGLFSAVLAFSPGFEAARGRQGRPRVFVSHGVDDPVLPIARSSRQIVPKLLREDYSVTFVEFDGPHAAPRAVQEQAAEWLGWAPERV